ncbi:RICIN domain-containing protein [Streptomyces sp. NBC_00986]|uniref:RICIN domain-containing protein n=1 Tax=Streptomyces sp. NBC_00986 TaxID=2903702 RepID=UPI003865A4C0|nr:RICIN domain-containing protein [Streptomyces sp. NBC_00986]
MHKSSKQFAIIAALTAAATVSISSPASAADYASYENRRTNVCLDSNSAGSAYTQGCNTGYNQDWDLQFISGTSYYLKNRATGRCLDANSANSVYTLSCNGGTNQRWRRVYPSSSSYGQWINVQTGKCLTATNLSGTHVVYTSVCTDSAENQQIRWIRI